MPILCILAKYGRDTITTIDEILGLEMGETRLLLRGLHSVIGIYKDSNLLTGKLADKIRWHHASLLDFLNNPSRSHELYVDGLQYRMHLARRFLHFASGRYRPSVLGRPSDSQQLFNTELIPLIISLPPSVQLCPLIERMNPEHIFELASDLKCMVDWLKKIPSAPPDLIQLWEDYVFMSSFRETNGYSQFDSHSKISLEPFPQSQEIHQVMVVMVFLTELFPSVRDTEFQLAAAFQHVRDTRLKPEAPFQHVRALFGHYMG
ncbi:NACHT domain-containing protein [Mycena sanguinolenta]|uniref:NACHT domain-containing protein n=1 Tax=Mycena sanguinolenta TaxID=230812 RepID=A0A8H6WXV7_9AGAR|nr:NACHT domain-containing protein [Mycena sanguinolenta]